METERCGLEGRRFGPSERDKVVLEGKYTMVGRQRQNHRERKREQREKKEK